jgi:ubiquinone/menaquinone biosynthesis C-methylase UbiE
VESWISSQAKCWMPEKRVLDVCCGVGLMTHQLRLSGYLGFAHGVDISPQMLREAKKRAVFDATTPLNVNNSGLNVFENSLFDLVICTGAMELLKDVKLVLSEFFRVLSANGRLWISFQAPSEATSHMNIFGVSRTEMEGQLTAAGFHNFEIVFVEEAFFTPKEGKMVPVPYFFVSAEKK